MEASAKGAEYLQAELEKLGFEGTQHGSLGVALFLWDSKNI